MEQLRKGLDRRSQDENNSRKVRSNVHRRVPTITLTKRTDLFTQWPCMVFAGSGFSEKISLHNVLLGRF